MGSGSGFAPLKIEELRVVTTFFELVGCNKPEQIHLQLLHKLWASVFLTNRIRMFSFQFYNNSLSVGSRVAARYRNTGTFIDQRCAFCVCSRTGVPHREDFSHIFIDCPAIMQTISGVWRVFFNKNFSNTDNGTRLFKTTGITVDTNGPDLFFNMLTTLLINFITWQFKIRRSIPSVATMSMEIDNLFSTIVTFPSLYNEALTHPSIVCRRWRNGGSRRG